MGQDLREMFCLAKAALPHMAEGSAIINTSSINANTPRPTLLPYATTKDAVRNFTGGLAVEPQPVIHRLLEPTDGRSEERRGGKECVSQCRSRWSLDH